MTKSNFRSWTKETELAILLYKTASDGAVKEKLYQYDIKPAFYGLAERLSPKSPPSVKEELVFKLSRALNVNFEYSDKKKAQSYFYTIVQNTLNERFAAKTPATPRKRKEYPKIKRGTGKNVYWTMDHQAAILKYVASTDNKERNRLYETMIGPALREMIDNIVYTFKFTTLPNIDSLKEECMHTLVTILSKFDEARGSKAFSYFSVIIKNHFIHAVKKNAKKTREEVPIDEELAHVEQRLLEQHEEFDYNRLRADKEYNEFLMEEVRSWEQNCSDDNERKVHNAIKQMMDNAENIEIMNRKAILVYIQELTGLERSLISPILTKTFKGMYEGAKKKWLNDED
jgi:DNA-directed RNA polymerase specialized sigma subunit